MYFELIVWNPVFGQVALAPRRSAGRPLTSAAFGGFGATISMANEPGRLEAIRMPLATAAIRPSLYLEARVFLPFLSLRAPIFGFDRRMASGGERLLRHHSRD